ncbi:MAG: peptidylprolyl isomerase [Acidobacteria bacterium]|nr:peptidylprolyl isomerase [Acidobacteriota bacterium]MCA1641427.1 peptidylprolyl isomerase [Acidobacteriota bacterium]
MRQKTKTSRPGSARARALKALNFAAPIVFVAALAAASHAQTAPAPRAARAQRPATVASRAVPEETLLRIVRAEDERRWDADDLGALVSDASPAVRARAALAAGRIGDARAVPALAALLQTDKDLGVRAKAAFALGETESAQGADALLVTSRPGTPPQVRARSIEALGKIAAALPSDDQANAKRIGEAIISALNFENGRKSKPEWQTILLGLTAALRARPANGAKTVALFLSYPEARVRADAANTLARLGAKDAAANEALRAMLASDADPVARANAARALGIAEDKQAFDALLDRAVNDRDSRVRVSALRGIALLKDARAADALVKRGGALFAEYRAAKVAGGAASHPAELSELLGVAAALGSVLPNTSDSRAITFLRAVREAEGWIDPETEIAFASVAPAQYMREKPFSNLYVRAADNKLVWQAVAAIAQGLGEFAKMTSERAGNSVLTVQADAQLALRSLLADKQTPALAVPDILRAVAAFKPLDLAPVMREQLKSDDVIVRATAAELLGGEPPDAESARALVAALAPAMRDEMNDAALATLDALGKQKSEEATAAIRSAMDSPDYLLRLRAAAILRAASPNGGADASLQTVAVRYHLADYKRALARRSNRVLAVVSTDKGAFTVELVPDDAPLNVDNFVQLARRGYFNGVAFHRVVPNFVVQGGDPRGDGNGGPGYQIRCEINEVPYDRGAVGMALSGKDTGGSQWFVTHSPQPHLDGGYTVFGRVTQGMDVVDRIARGDRIRGVTVTETPKQK